MRERLNEFSDETKDQVREEQNGSCALCGKKCNGHQMQIHHKIPVSMGGTGTRENAIGLCRKPRPCHELFDQLALKYGIFYDDVRMQMGQEYIVGVRTELLMNNDERKRLYPKTNSSGFKRLHSWYNDNYGNPPKNFRVAQPTQAARR